VGNKNDKERKNKPIEKEKKDLIKPLKNRPIKPTNSIESFAFDMKRASEKKHDE